MVEAVPGYSEAMKDKKYLAFIDDIESSLEILLFWINA